MQWQHLGVVDRLCWILPAVSINSLLEKLLILVIETKQQQLVVIPASKTPSSLSSWFNVSEVMFLLFIASCPGPSPSSKGGGAGNEGMLLVVVSSKARQTRFIVSHQPLSWFACGRAVIIHYSLLANTIYTWQTCDATTIKSGCVIIWKAIMTVEMAGLVVSRRWYETSKA